MAMLHIANMIVIAINRENCRRMKTCIVYYYKAIWLNEIKSSTIKLMLVAGSERHFWKFKNRIQIAKQSSEVWCAEFCFPNDSVFLVFHLSLASFQKGKINVLFCFNVVTLNVFPQRHPGIYIGILCIACIFYPAFLAVGCHGGL